jgi:mono/diheme cytochrome c family protein
MRTDTKTLLALWVAVGGTLALPTASFAADAAAGAAAWTKEYPQTDGSPPRSCVACHGRDLTQPGRHAVTNKVIEPLAPSVNPQRLTDQAKVEKWLLRNCRWTLGRECTPEEKADFISYIETQ